MQEKIEEVLLTIPYEKIRSDAFDGLLKDDILKGVGMDTGYMCMEQMDLFKLRHERNLKNEVWGIIMRHVRKTLNHNINEYTRKRFSEEAMKYDLSMVDIGEAATA